METTLRSNKWLISNNFKIDIPKLPVGVFADFGLFPSNQQLNKVYFEYNVGIFSKIYINDEIIGIYLPVLFSENIGTSIKELKVLQRVSFIFNLNNINPFEIKKTIRP